MLKTYFLDDIITLPYLFFNAQSLICSFIFIHFEKANILYRLIPLSFADARKACYCSFVHLSMSFFSVICRVVSGSRDATLRVWDIETGHCLHVLQGHVAAVRCVQYDGKRVVSGAYDYTVRVWDPETETCLHTLQGHTNRVYSLQFDGVHVVSGSLDTSIKVGPSPIDASSGCILPATYTCQYFSWCILLQVRSNGMDSYVALDNQLFSKGNKRLYELV